MANTLVFTPNGACSNLVVLRGIIPGASYDHTWLLEDWDCAAGTLDGGGAAGSANTDFTGQQGFVLWFADAAGALLVQVAGAIVGSPQDGKVRFNVRPADTELLRGQTIARCGAAFVDSAGRYMPLESGRYHVEEWPAITWPT